MVARSVQLAWMERPERTLYGQPSGGKCQAHRVSQVVRAAAPLQPRAHGARLLSAIGLLASVEAHSTAQGTTQAADLLLVLVCAAVGLWALRRYIFLLMRAEETANQANCPDCGEYGRFRVVCERAREHELDVRCHKCGREWVINTPD